MGQYFPSMANIGSLSESGGTVTLADSHLRIGGQGYQTGSLDLALGTMTANTRYQIYAVVSSGSVILVKSTNENSVGPAGYDSWKLVGSLYSEAADTFGSFVNIEGMPTSDWIPFTPTVNAHLGTLANVNMQYRRVGNVIEEIGSFDVGTIGGSGEIQIGLPSLTVELPSSSTEIVGKLDHNLTGTRTYFMLATHGDTFLNVGTFQHDTNKNVLVESASNVFNTGTRTALSAKVPVQEWSNTPIKDL